MPKTVQSTGFDDSITEDEVGEATGPGKAPQTVEAARRTSSVERETRETKVGVCLELDGSGRATVSTGLGFFDHMLELLAGHGLFNLEIQAKGDLHTGGHHTVEDVGICLGTALAEALGDKRGINRYGNTIVPMDEALVLVALDLSGRPYFTYEGGPVAENIAGFESALVAEFLRAVVNNARMTLHVHVLAGGDVHHTIEAVFKAFGRSLRQAVTLDPRTAGIPSTKGVL
ncbi:MAG: imidazoleglycerol-phosphate dehydratase HisB [Thermoleophilia bacterium]|nr:imidazoleglycerol-phosphate dehydratase HisB [Thermoleophilia bacterium]